MSEAGRVNDVEEAVADGTRDISLYLLGLKSETPERRRVFAWAFTARNADGSITTDSGGQTMLPDGTRVPAATSGDVVDTPEAEQAFEDAFYDFTASGEASADDMHEDWNVARIVGGVFFSSELKRALKLDGAVPTGALVVVDIPKTDRGNQLWEDVKTGRRRMMSMVAALEREPIAETANA